MDVTDQTPKQNQGIKGTRAPENDRPKDGSQKEVKKIRVNNNNNINMDNSKQTSMVLK